jgi:hypothetical protein
LKKGDSGGFENLQGERIFGKPYNLKNRFYSSVLNQRSWDADNLRSRRQVRRGMKSSQGCRIRVEELGALAGARARER